MNLATTKMVNNYQGNFPKSVLFGVKRRFDLWSMIPEAKRGKILILGSDRFLHAEKNREFLRQENLIKLSVPSSEPTLEMVEELTEAARAAKIESIVAVGGGSVIDSAKAVAIYLEQSPSTRLADFFYNKKTLSQRENIFFAALPTTAGTGAEVTPNSVLKDTKTHIKQSLKVDSMLPDIALVDPELTYDCPPQVTSCSGLDALTQNIESAISRNRNHLSYSMARSAFLLAFKNLQAAFEGDCEAKNNMAEATMTGGMAFSMSSLGAVHGLAHPLGALLNIPHGLVCGILLTEVLKCNIEAVNLFAEDIGYGKNQGVKLIDEITALRANLQVVDNFRQYNLKRSDFDFVVKNCRSGSMKTNPIDLSDQDIINLLERVS